MLKSDPLAKKAVVKPTDIINHPLIVSEQSLQENRLQTWWGNQISQLNIIATFSLGFNAQFLVKNTGAYMFSFDHLLDERK